MDKVFWGVTEFVHLIDIINQTDLVENIDGEDKLGQPMIKFSLPLQWGTVDMFLLPYFRERTFPGHNGRLRHAQVIDTNRAKYESSLEEYHIDFALRYSHILGDFDIGISNFTGTGRELTSLIEYKNSGEPDLIPYYEQINQTSIDIQLVEGAWLWKMEAFYRTGQGDGFFAGVGGFEYTLYDIFETGMDVGLLTEYAYDDRDNEDTTPFEDDLMFGIRLTGNDVSTTELLVGMFHDILTGSKVVTTEASRRMGQNYTLSLESRLFLNSSEDDYFYELRSDDYFRIKFSYYF